MTRCSSAVDVATYSQEHPNLSLGLHVDLGEWFCRNGTWIPLYEVVPLEDKTAVADEVVCQLDVFNNLIGRNPTHIDSHQHVHLREPIRPILIEISRKLGVPLRHCSPKIHYCGDFYGQTIDGSSLPDTFSVASLIKILEALPSGITELSCHPGEGGPKKLSPVEIKGFSFI
jgi:predicted glycoside hydrolase/deacetylase ChbG (UPF0249 family)